jgi:hypothetical protein
VGRFQDVGGYCSGIYSVLGARSDRAIKKGTERKGREERKKEEREKGREERERSIYM